MEASTTTRRSLLAFFLLVFAFSLLFELFVALSRPFMEHFYSQLPLSIPAGFDPLSPFIGGYIPLFAACILIGRTGEPGSINRLLRRAFDYRRIRPIIWYLPALLISPLLYFLSYWAMRLLRLPLPEPHIAWWAIPIFFVLFFIEALGEEIGWTGYALDPLQERWGALGAGLILGIITALWHIVPGLQAHQALTYIAWQGACDLGWRVLGVWIYNNSGRSVFAAILFHDTYNIGYVLFPNTGSHYDPAIAFPITMLIALIVTSLWGANTLAHFRFARQRENDLS